MPDEAYLNNTAADKKFSGIVWVTNWQGAYIKGFKFNGDGSYAYLGSPTYSSKVQNGNNVELKYKTNELFCYPKTYSGYNLAGGERTEWSYTIISCVDIGSPGGHGGDQEMPPTDYGDEGCAGCDPTPEPEPDPDPKAHALRKVKLKQRLKTPFLKNKKQIYKLK